MAAVEGEEPPMELETQAVKTKVVRNKQMRPPPRVRGGRTFKRVYKASHRAIAPPRGYGKKRSDVYWSHRRQLFDQAEDEEWVENDEEFEYGDEEDLYNDNDRQLQVSY